MFLLEQSDIVYIGDLRFFISRTTVSIVRYLQIQIWFKNLRKACVSKYCV